MTGRALLLVVPFLVAACGGSGGSKGVADRTISTTTPANATAAVNRAIAKAAKTPVHGQVSAVVSTSGERVHLTGAADIDPKSRLGTMHVAMGLAGQQIPLDEVLDGSKAYVSSAFFKSFLPSGKTWLEVSLSSASNLGAAGFALTSQPGAVPPLKNARQVGTATIDGMQTTEYAAKVDQAKLSTAEKDALSGAHVGFGTVDVWVGTDGYVHRARIETSSSGAQKATIVVTTTMSNYGEKVHVTVPPASQTVNANDVGIPGFSS